MSQEKPTRPLQQQQGQGDVGLSEEQQPIKYGDVFNVSGDLASRPVTPLDVAMMQSSENTILGHAPAGGAAAAVRSSAAWNERARPVGPGAATDIAAREGATVTGTDVPGGHLVTEQIGGQVVGKHVEAKATQGGTWTGSLEQNAITIGAALEAAAQSAGGKPVSRSDAAGIQTAEHIATGGNTIIPGGLAATAQSAAAYNESTLRNEDKIKLSQVLSGASGKLPADKVVTQQDALEIENAEKWNSRNMETQLGGVAASMVAAARFNENLKP